MRGGAKHRQQESHRITASIGSLADKISQEVRSSSHRRVGWIERRGLVNPGRFKLESGKQQKGGEVGILVVPTEGEGGSPEPGAKRSVLKKSSHLLAAEEPSLTFRKMRDVCKKFNIQRKDAYNIRSEFFSLLRMYEAVKGSRRSSNFEEDDTSMECKEGEW